MNAERNRLRKEMAFIDALLARRKALDECTTRYDKIAKAIQYASRTEDAEADLAKMTASAELERLDKEAAEADNAKLREEVGIWQDKFNRQTQVVKETALMKANVEVQHRLAIARAEAAEAREAALVACLQRLRDAVKQYRVSGTLGSPERIKSWRHLLEIVKQVDALLAVQPRQEDLRERGADSPERKE